VAQEPRPLRRYRGGIFAYNFLEENKGQKIEVSFLEGEQDRNHSLVGEKKIKGELL